MGNELINDNDFKENDPIDFSNDYFRYGIINKKNGEKSLEDTYLTFINSSVLDSTPKNSDFSLFGVFDGHNNDFVAKYISENIQKLYQKEIGDINEKNYKQKIVDIFKEMDKQLKEKDVRKEEEKEKNTIEEEKNVINDSNVIHEKDENKEKDKKYYIDVEVDEKEVNLFKDIIKNSKEIPDDLKSIEDSQIKDLILFKNLFKYNNNYLYNNKNVDYIGASGSVVLINDTNVITADLGITACVVFNKNGEIKNMKDKKNIKDLKELKEEHTFNNKEEKRRIKKFNKDIDYNNLKLNIYVPASRCFGLFKYKQDEILKEENQIISCVPEVNLYDINNIDYILLMTKGMINLIGDDLKLLIERIVNELKIDDKDDKKEIDKNIKISKIIEDFIIQREKEAEKNNLDTKNNINTTGNKAPTAKTNNYIYIGKDDFAEENIIINELNNNYYKDIMNLNKNSDNNCHGKYNITCMLIQLFKNKIIEKKKKVENENKKDEEKENKIIEKPDKKEEKNEIKEDETKKNEDKNKIEENVKKETEDKPIEENKIIIKEENKIEQDTKDENDKNKTNEEDKNKKEENEIKNEESKDKPEEGNAKIEEIKNTSDEGKNKDEENKDKPEEEKNKIVEKESEENKVEENLKEKKGEQEKEDEKKNENEIKGEKNEIKSDVNNDSEQKEKKEQSE